MHLRNQELATSKRPSTVRLVPGRRGPLDVAVAIRRQTPEEQRRFNAAFEVFLAEMVRLHLDRSDKQ